MIDVHLQHLREDPKILHNNNLTFSAIAYTLAWGSQLPLDDHSWVLD